jgi:hypothetical protein
MDAIVARTSLRLLSCTSKSAEKTAIQRIRRKITSGRGRPCKACETPASRKRKWLEKRVGDIERLETRQPYCIPPWRPPLDIRIASFKKEAEKRHSTDENIVYIQIYIDGSGLNDRVIAAAVTLYNYTATQLRDIGNA